MRPQHGLSAAHVRVAGYHSLRIPARQCKQRSGEIGDLPQYGVGGRSQVQPDVERDLFVSAAPGVNLLRKRAHFFAQFADDECMDIFIHCGLEIIGVVRFPRDLIEGRQQLPAFHAGHNSGSRQSPRKRLRSFYINEHELAVEMERTGELLEDLRGPALESAAPKLHEEDCRSEARTLIGRPIKLMKPNASFWS